MPRVSEQHMAARRQEILDSARACFAREGFHASSMHDIYRGCELSPGAVYNHFASKEEIVRSLGESQLRAAEAQREALAQVEDPVDALRMLAAATRSALEREEDQRLALQLAAESLRDETVAQVARATFEAVHATVAGLLARAQEEGHLQPDADADALASVLIAIFQGFVLQRAIGVGPDRERHIAVVRSMLAPLLSPTARERLAQSPPLGGSA